VKNKEANSRKKNNKKWILKRKEKKKKSRKIKKAEFGKSFGRKPGTKGLLGWPTKGKKTQNRNETTFASSSHYRSCHASRLSCPREMKKRSL
jgi:hypothetical protein